MQSNKTKRYAPLVVVAAAALALAACGSSGSKSSSGSSGAASASASASASSFSPAKTTPGGQLTFALDQAPANFNVNTVDGNALETSQIDHGILPTVSEATPNASFSFDPNLFSSPPALTSSSPETVTYHINPNAVWSDGKPIDASDFIYLWKAMNGTNAKFNAASTSGYSQVKSVTGSDNGKTVTVVFSTPFSEWQGLFASAGGNFLLPAHLLDGKGPDGFNNGMANGPLKAADGSYISGGPYLVQSYKANDSLVEVPNPKWWGTPKPQLNKIVFSFIQDSTQLPAALQNNEVDLIDPTAVTADEAAQIAKISRMSAQSIAGLQFEHIDFNFHNQFLKDPVVRKAVATAIDRRQLIAATVGQVAPTTKPLGNHIYVPSQPQYVDHSGNYGLGNADAAKQMLTADGYTLGSDGYFTKGGQQLKFGITAKAGSQLRKNEEDVMQAQLKKAGINLQIANTPKTIGQFTAAHDYDIALFAWVGGPFVISGNAPIYQTAPKGGTSSNTQFYSSPKTDQLFTQAQAELDPAKAAALANQADQQIWDDMATFPLFQRPTYTAVDKKFANIGANPTQDGPAWDTWLWGLKSQ